MLRLLSIIGIAIAMVIGFAALTRQMHDDYSVRSSVVKAVTQVKQSIAQRLSCSDNTQPGQTSSLSLKSENVSPQGRATDQQSEDADMPEIFSALEFATTGNQSVTATGTFKDVKGESGKLRIKAGRKIIMNCSCKDTRVSCDNIQSDINKKYIPGKNQT